MKREEDAPNAEEALAAQAAEHREQLLRMKADFENAKKRLERDKDLAVQFANEKLLVEVLHIADTFDRAMQSLAEKHDPEQVRKGLALAQDQMHKILEKHGLKPVESVGKPFDPNFHEAVGMVPSDEEEGTVVDEVQRGYQLNGRLIRPSRVRIAAKKED